MAKSNPRKQLFVITAPDDALTLLLSDDEGAVCLFTTSQKAGVYKRSAKDTVDWNTRQATRNVLELCQEDKLGGIVDLEADETPSTQRAWAMSTILKRYPMPA